MASLVQFGLSMTKIYTNRFNLPSGGLDASTYLSTPRYLGNFDDHLCSKQDPSAFSKKRLPTLERAVGLDAL